MKNAFYLMLKDLFVLEIFTFLFWIFSYAKNDLIRKLCLISKFLTSQAEQKTAATHIGPNIPRNKGNQAMKFGQLIEYNIRNIFLEKSYSKCGGKASHRPFYKK